jgi:hypothetical protein
MIENTKTIRHRHLPITLLVKIGLPVLIMGIAGLYGACDGVHQSPTPLFRFEIPLPTGTSTAAELTVRQGTTFSLPVAIVSTRDEPVELKLDVDHEKEFPEDIRITAPEGYITIPTGKRVDIVVVYQIAGTVAPGLYHTHLIGTLREPIQGAGGIARAIDIIVTDTTTSPPANENQSQMEG